jgi:hypothetical protein
VHGVFLFSMNLKMSVMEKAMSSCHLRLHHHEQVGRGKLLQVCVRRRGFAVPVLPGADLVALRVVRLWESFWCFVVL